MTKKKQSHFLRHIGLRRLWSPFSVARHTVEVQGLRADSSHGVSIYFIASGSTYCAYNTEKQPSSNDPGGWIVFLSANG